MGTDTPVFAGIYFFHYCMMQVPILSTSFPCEVLGTHIRSISEWFFVGVRGVIPCEDKHTIIGLGELRNIDTVLRLYLILIVLFDCVSAALGFVLLDLQPTFGFNVFS